MPDRVQVYLDHNSTTFLHPEVLEAMVACERSGYANPASQHRAGRRARAVLEDAREGIADLLGANSGGHRRDQLIFTSGGTEANNLAIRGLAVRRHDEPLAVGISAIEHPSVLEAAEYLRQGGAVVTRLPVTADGRIDLGTALEFVRHRPALISVMLGNNETGVLQPVQELSAPCREHRVCLHTDAVQAIGKVPVNFVQLGIDAMTITAHKFQGPRGIGALIVRHGVALEPLMVGGSQQFGKRPGTESISLAVGMHLALRLALRDLDKHQAHMLALRDALERQLTSVDAGGLVNGTAPRLPHTLNISFPGLDRQALVMALDMAGIFCSTGSACSSGSSEPSHVLLAMNCGDQRVGSSVRFSLSPLTTFAEVEIACRRILSLLRDLRRQTSL